MLLLYADGESISAVARALGTNHPRVERTLDKALQMGAAAALPDMPGRGRPPRRPALRMQCQNRLCVCHFELIDHVFLTLS